MILDKFLLEIKKWEVTFQFRFLKEFETDICAKSSFKKIECVFFVEIRILKTETKF